VGSDDRAARGERRDADFICSSLLIAGALYPFWHLLASPSAFDPWPAWWLLGGYALVVGALGRRVRALREHLHGLWYAFMWMVVGHFTWLASVNQDSFFYSIGSVIGVIASALMIPSRGALLAFAGFVAALNLARLAAVPAPPGAFLAISGSCLLLLAFAYRRLVGRLGADREISVRQESLERLVAERTRELSEQAETLKRVNARLRREMQERERLEEQLRRSQKLDALGRLAGGVAHDFNNLLTAITGYAEVLRTGLPEGSPLREDAEQICQVADRASGLTSQLLAFSRQNGVDAPVLELDAVLGDAARMLIATMGEGIKTEIRLGAPGCGIRIHRNQLDQVLLNLVVNARDAMARGGTLEVETSVRAKGDDSAWPPGLGADRRVVLRVADTGDGMDAETAARAFDPFFTTKDVGKGTGLGLSIVYGIVQQSGGQIRLDSEPGSGTRFEISWPLVERPAEAGPPAPRPAPRGSERILVVEDEGPVRHLVHRVLEGGGYRVVEAQDAESALRIVSEDRDPIDLVVTDVVMPRMSGIELARRLGNERPDLKVLFMSGHLDHPSLREGSLPPGSLLLPKPFQPKELGAAVREILDRPAA
jgi:signal transduction histidine kinase/CheY-like chemotaxis protein